MSAPGRDHEGPTWPSGRPERFGDLAIRRAPLQRAVVAAVRLASRGRSHHFLRALAVSPRMFWLFLLFNGRLLLFGPLGRRQTELVILRVAARCGSQYEWTQHIPLARRAGVAPASIAAAGVVAATPTVDTAALPPGDRLLLTATDELLDSRVLSDTTWTALRETQEPRVIMDLCLLVGNYAMLASALNSFGVPLEPAWDAPA